VLQNFYERHGFKDRPLYITGESYAGKYVPSIAHFIVQMAARASGDTSAIRRPRAIPEHVRWPDFRLGGVAIGNGWVGEPLGRGAGLQRVCLRAPVRPRCQGRWPLAGVRCRWPGRRPQLRAPPSRCAAASPRCRRAHPAAGHGGRGVEHGPG
jgi:hypothetical protein